MRIAETFHSIQGEGILSGTPSFFIRLSGCNLRCRWCDTPYASWHPEGTDWDVMALAHAASESGAHHAVITGGEPLIAPALPDLMQALKDQGLHLTLETAGTLPPADFPCDLASLSPKLANSTPSIETAGVAWVERHEKTRLQPDILRQWCQFSDYQLKFVVADGLDSPR